MGYEFNGSAMRRLRREMGLTSTDLAIHLGSNTRRTKTVKGASARLMRWERGSHEPSLDEVLIMARLFGVRPIDLLKPGDRKYDYPMPVSQSIEMLARFNRIPLSRLLEEGAHD